MVIKRRTYENIGSVAVSGIVYTKHFNAANELSFTVHAQDSDVWDKINDYNIVYLPEYEEYFDMQIEKSEEQDVVKNVSCHSLCESELSQVNLYDIEINTEVDIARNNYNPKRCQKMAGYHLAYRNCRQGAQRPDNTLYFH